jgi:cytochrome c oxidase cbb3-type subunit I/II
MLDPESMSPGSIMPPYPWLITDDLDTSRTADKIKALQTLGTPYGKGYASIAVDDLNKQAAQVVASLKKDGIEQEGLAGKEIVALIAYLQRLGTDINKSTEPAK